MGKWDKLLKKNSDGTKTCVLCRKKFNEQKQGNTNVFLRHFKNDHNEEYRKIQNCSLKTTETEEPAAKKSQPQIDHCFSAYADNGPKTVQTQRALTQLIASAALPLSLVEHAGFRNFMKIVAPRFMIKSRSQLTRMELPKLYEEYQEKLKNSLSDVQDVAISFDCWTDSARKHEYLALIVHFVENEQIVYRVLNVLDVSDKSHTGEYLADKMKKAIDFFEIQGKIRACVRDGASNARCASNKISEVNFDCLAHKLNLAAKCGTDGFAGLESVLTKLKKSSKAIRVSSNLRREWEAIFDQLDSPTLLLKKHIDTRWTSLYEVLKRAVSVREQLELFFVDHDDLEPITDAEWKTCSLVIDLLQPLMDALKLVQAKDFTCSSIIPLCKVILADLDVIKKNVSAKNKIIEKLSVELEKFESLDYLNFATILDVRFKGCFVNAYWKDQLLNSMLETIEEEKDGPQSETEASTSSEKSDPFARFMNSSSEKAKIIPSDKKAVVVGEHDRWLSEPPDINTSPIKFWSQKTNQYAFPTLFMLQKAYFCTPASSVETERLFSTARTILTDNRKCLSAENFSALLFLQRNLPLMGFE